MSRALARLAGWTAGYLFIVLLERVALAAQERVVVDDLEVFDASDVLEAHRGCCYPEWAA